MTASKEQKLLEIIAGKGYQGELFTQRNDRIQVLFEDQILSYVKIAANQGYYLRIQDNDGHIGETSFTRLDDLAALVDNTLATVKYRKPSPLDFEGQSDYCDSRFQAPAWSELSDSRIIELGQNFVDGLQQIDANIKGPLFLQKDHYDVAISTTSQASRCFEKSLFTLEFEGKISREGDLLQINRFYSHGRDLPDVAAIIASIRQDYDYSQKTVAISSGHYDVILDPFILEDLARPIEACFSGRNIEKQISLLAGREGEQIFDSRIDLVDDPTLPFLENSVPFDDEGVVAPRIHLVRGGVMTDRLLDKDSAARLGESSNGRGFKRRPLLGGRSYRADVAPGLTNLVLKPGSASEQEIFHASKRAIYIKSLMGTLLGYHLNGVVAGNIWLGYLVENGEIVGRIKDVQFNINVFDVLKEQLGLLGNEATNNRCYQAPMLLLHDIEISTK